MIDTQSTFSARTADGREQLGFPRPTALGPVQTSAWIFFLQAFGTRTLRHRRSMHALAATHATFSRPKPKADLCRAFTDAKRGAGLQGWGSTSGRFRTVRAPGSRMAPSSVSQERLWHEGSPCRRHDENGVFAINQAASNAAQRFRYRTTRARNQVNKNGTTNMAATSQT